MPANTPLGYTGQFRDPVFAGYPMGNGHRIYLPSLMRFSSPDVMSPFGKGGTNPYAYCAGDPIDRSDPSGNFSVFAILGAGMAIGGLALGIHNGTRAWSMAASALGDGGEGLLSRTGGMAAAHAAGAVSAFSAAKLGGTLAFTASMGGPHQFRRNMRLFGAGIGMTIAGVAPLALKKRTLSDDTVRLLRGREERVQIDMQDINPETTTTRERAAPRGGPSLRSRIFSRISEAAANGFDTLRSAYRRVAGTGEMSSHQIIGPFRDNVLEFPNPSFDFGDHPYNRPLIVDPNLGFSIEDADDIGDDDL